MKKDNTENVQTTEEAKSNKKLVAAGGVAGVLALTALIFKIKK